VDTRALDVDQLAGELDARLAAADAVLAARVRAKLAAEPVEDLRSDFEGGYGARGDEAEDADAAAAAASLAASVRAGTAPSFWQLPLGLVRRSPERGYYQGWDLRPAQLPTRYAATFAFYRDGPDPAGLAGLARPGR
jgi:Domain of unknown function (DUF6986)